MEQLNPRYVDAIKYDYSRQRRALIMGIIKWALKDYLDYLSGGELSFIGNDDPHRIFEDAEQYITGELFLNDCDEAGIDSCAMYSKLESHLKTLLKNGNGKGGDIKRTLKKIRKRLEIL